MGWEFKNGAGEGFGWDRRTGERIARARSAECDARGIFGAVAAGGDASKSADARPGGFCLCNPQPTRGKFSAGDLRWLEQIVRHVGPPLENVFLMRSLRARAIESERSRISRDLHDGILQTLLSLNIQLDVLRRKLAARSPSKPARTWRICKKPCSRKATNCAAWSPTCGRCAWKAPICAN